MGELIAIELTPVPGVVGLLEELLERAREGELRSLVVAAGTDMGGTATCYELGDGDVAHLVCAMERAKLRLLTDTDED